MGRFRKKIYSVEAEYLLSELDASGLEKWDGRADLYAAFLDSDIVASIRLMPAPYECAGFVNRSRLREFLLDQWESRYLEFSRLLIAREHRLPELTQYLMIYAGLMTLNATSFRRYFGYAKPIIGELIKRSFDVVLDRNSFRIPNRGDHDYVLLKGCFFDHFRQVDFSVDDLAFLPKVMKQREAFFRGTGHPPAPKYGCCRPDPVRR